MTVREHIEAIRLEAMKPLDPDRVVELLNMLSALYGSITEHHVQAEMDYNRLYEQMTNKYEKVSEARAKAKATDVYEKKIKMDALIKSTEELINSLKYLVKLKIQEMSHSRNA
jgi:hypothetical protein